MYKAILYTVSSTNTISYNCAKFNVIDSILHVTRKTTTTKQCISEPSQKLLYFYAILKCSYEMISRLCIKTSEVETNDI